MNTERRQFVCPNCGSTDVYIDRDNTIYCSTCSTTFELTSPKCTTDNKSADTVTKNMPPSFRTKKQDNDSSKQKENDIHENLSNSFQPNKSDNIFRVKDITTTTAFARTALLELATGDDVPSDIFSSQFKPVVSEDEQYYLQFMKVDIQYSASIGHDYTVENQVWDDQKRKYVKETKTVTNWTPFSDRNTLKEIGISALKTNGDRELQAERFHNCAGMIAENRSAWFTKPDQEPIYPNSTNRVEAMEMGEKSAAITCQANLPGDRYQNFSYNCDTTAEAAVILMVKDNVLRFDYHGKQGEVRGYTFEETAEITIPPTATSLTTKVSAYLSTIGSATRFLLAFNIIFAIVTAFLCLNGNASPILTWICVLLLIAGVALTIVFFVRRNSIISELAYKQQTEKRTSLITLLKKMELPPLTDEEAAKIATRTENITSHLKSLSYNLSIRIMIVISTLFLIIAAYLSSTLSS